MKFGNVPLLEAEGAILAQTVRIARGAVKKGTLLGAGEIARLAAAGVETVMVAMPGIDDLDEDTVAARVARAVVGKGVRVADPFTGRANVFAEVDGTLSLDAGLVHELNAVDETITVATLPPFTRVAAGQMVATIKVIPFAVGGGIVDRAERLATSSTAKIAVHPFRARRVHLIITRFAHDKESVLKKRRNAVAERIASLGGVLANVVTCMHDTAELAAELQHLEVALDDIVLVFGTSAILDRRDVVPAALERAGGAVEHLGMPVDPGNLLMLGRLGGAITIGVPSCASAPKVNGFDWVLERAYADMPLDGTVVARMGVGGLLGEIATRPQPRRHALSAADSSRKVSAAVVVLAAGRSTRMGSRFKLTEPIAGKPMVRHTVENALASRARPVIAVTGHRSEDVRAALAGLDVTIVHNPDYHDGLSTSLKVGIDSLGAECDAAIIMLGDMPNVSPAIVNQLLDAFSAGEENTICVPTASGKRGNPVLWGAPFFSHLRDIKGDTGAKHLLGEFSSHVVDVAIEEPGIFVDVDTEDALRQLRDDE